MSTELAKEAFDSAIAWISKAQQLGYYSGDTPRILRTAAEAVRKVLTEEETESTALTLNHINDIHKRLIYNSEGAKQDSIKNYITRVKRILRDYNNWLLDPIGFRPSKGNGTTRPPKESSIKSKGADVKQVPDEALQSIPLTDNSHPKEDSIRNQGADVKRVPDEVLQCDPLTDNSPPAQDETDPSTLRKTQEGTSELLKKASQSSKPPVVIKASASSAGFRLPNTSYEPITRIIKAYAASRADVGADDLSKLLGIGVDNVGRNNGFLLELGLIEGGAKKRITARGRALARALEHEMPDEIQSHWFASVEDNEFLQKVISTVRIDPGQDISQFQARIVYLAEASKNSRTIAGAGAVIDILKAAGVLLEKDGKLRIASLERHVRDAEPAVVKESAPEADERSNLRVDRTTQGKPIPETNPAYSGQNQRTEKKKAIAAPEPLPGEPFGGSETEFIDYLVHYCKKTGFEFSQEIIENVYLSFKVRPVVVLSGPSGVGKTALARLIGEAFGSSVEGRDALRVAVEAHWTDGRHLLGRRGATGRFFATDFYRLLLRAASCPSRLYHVTFDEMNLAHVEYYFAQMLSAMESDGILVVPDQAGSRSHMKLPQVNHIPLLRIFGTINIDETTQVLSDKVVDRVNLIELDANLPPERILVHSSGTIEQRWHLPFERISMWQRLDVEELTVPQEIRDIWGILSCDSSVQPIQEVSTGDYDGMAPSISFGRRISNDIATYVTYAERLGGTIQRQDAIDLQIKQRILPKIRGDSRLANKLQQLAGYLEKRGFHRSAVRVRRMRAQLHASQFVTFWS